MFLFQHLFLLSLLNLMTQYKTPFFSPIKPLIIVMKYYIIKISIKNNQYFIYQTYKTIKDMYQSKMVRSALRSKKTNTNKFVPLIKIDNDKVYTQKQGIDVLKKITSGSLLILAFEQSETQIPFKLFECYQLNNPHNESGIWISQNFIEDDEYGYKLICLIGHANTSEDLIRIHLFHSIIASVVVINVYPQFTGFKFLKAIEGRVSYNKLQKDNHNLVNELANLIILERDQLREVTMMNDQNKIRNIQKQQGITDLHKTYRSVNFFKFPLDDELKYNKKIIEDFYLKVISLHLTAPKQTKKLQYGPVLAEYLPEIVRQYNSKYSVNYTESLDKIQIDDGYEAYMEGIQLYNQSLKRKFNGNEPVQHPQQDLVVFREQAVAQYKSRTRDMEYLMELNNTIDDKQKKILKINDSMWHQKNIDLLRKQSKNLLKYAENRDTSFDVKKQTQRITNVYNSRAGGRTKDEDFNGFLQKLNQTLGEDNYNKNMKISKLQSQNRRMQDRLKKLQKGGCCSGKCQIM